jgi:hypothetical protein
MASFLQFSLFGGELESLYICDRPQLAPLKTLPVSGGEQKREVRLTASGLAAPATIKSLGVASQKFTG